MMFPIFRGMCIKLIFFWKRMRKTQLNVYMFLSGRESRVQRHAMFSVWSIIGGRSCIESAFQAAR